MADQLFVLPIAGSSRAAWLIGKLLCPNLQITSIQNHSELPVHLLTGRSHPPTLPLLSTFDVQLEGAPAIVRYLVGTADRNHAELAAVLYPAADLAQQTRIDALLDWATRVLAPALAHAVQVTPAVVCHSVCFSM